MKKYSIRDMQPCTEAGFGYVFKEDVVGQAVFDFGCITGLGVAYRATTNLDGDFEVITNTKITWVYFDNREQCLGFLKDLNGYLAVKQAALLSCEDAMAAAKSVRAELSNITVVAKEAADASKSAAERAVDEDFKLLEILSKVTEAEQLARSAHNRFKIL